MPAGGKTIDLEQLANEQPSKQDVDSWIAKERANLDSRLEQREEYLRVLCILQENYGCGITYNPKHFDLTGL